MCDITRAQPRRECLRAIFEELPQLRRADVTILIATGTHRANTDAELERMLGRDILDSCRVVNHDSRNQATLERVGRTSTGVEVFLNREWLAADVRITTGFVEPHFFAGFSGGPKMVAPGLAGLDTVLTLHDAARIGDPRATWGITEGNPIHDDVRAVAAMAPPHFSIDVALNRDQQITAAFAGNLFAEHRAACAHVKAHRDAGRPRPLRRRGHDELGLPAGPEPVSSREGDVGGRADRQDGRRDHLRRRVSGRLALARLVRRGVGVAAQSRPRSWT